MPGLSGAIMDTHWIKSQSGWEIRNFGILKDLCSTILFEPEKNYEYSKPLGYVCLQVLWKKPLGKDSWLLPMNGFSTAGNEKYRYSPPLKKR